MEKPPIWSTDQLAIEREVSIARFVSERTEEGPRLYSSSFEKALPAVRKVMETTGDLQGLSATVLTDHPELWRVLRYFCGPQISEEDFWTYVGQKFSRLPEKSAEAAASVLRNLIDERRFPWIEEARPPSDVERHAAELATATLLAHEMMRTARRGTAAKGQEADVCDVLREIGYAEILKTDRREIRMLDDMPRGSFSAEQKVGGAKCDVPVRLFDGRLLAIECKVSNGPKNSWKRLVREIGGKSTQWRQSLGTQQVLTSGVLGGVFDLSCLIKAQNEHDVFIFWHHDLDVLRSFVSNAR